MPDSEEPVGPSPDVVHPLTGQSRLVYLKNVVTNPRIDVGDFTYYDDFDDPMAFEKNVRYHFDFIGDRLVIGRFCSIASGATFLMNGGNPARTIRKRFDEATIEALLSIRWWDWDAAKITRNVTAICSGDLECLRSAS